MLYAGLAYHINPKWVHVDITRLEQGTGPGEEGGGEAFS